MNKTLSILRFFTASIFLLSLLVQPVHQLEHLVQQIDHKHEFHHYESCRHAGHITDDNHCKFCDFTFSPSVEYTVQLLDVPLLFNGNFDSLNVEAPQHFISQYVVHKQLRAPPVHA